MRKNINVSEEELFSIPLPQRTKTYTPISNRDIISSIKREAINNNLEFLDSNYQVGRNGNQVIGTLDFKGNNEDFGIRVMFKNSYDKSMSFGLALGNSVWICSNGMVSGEISLKRIHTGNADEEAYEKIIQGFSMAGDIYNKLITDSDIMKSIPLNSDIALKLISVLFFKKGILNTQMLNIIKQELYNSTIFNNINNSNFTLWDWYNHITGALKLSNTNNYMSNHIALHSFVENEFRLDGREITIN